MHDHHDSDVHVALFFLVLNLTRNVRCRKRVLFTFILYCTVVEWLRILHVVGRILYEAPLCAESAMFPRSNLCL